MKQYLLASILAVILHLAGTTTMAQIADEPLGNGTSGSPYQIASLENLYWIAASDAVISSPTQAIRWAAYYEQTDNIDASSTSGWFSGAGWKPIGYEVSYVGTTFTGSYDGQGHTITGLYINNAALESGGLFGVTAGATIKNLGMVNVSIYSQYNVGGLIGDARSSMIDDCFTTGTVSTPYSEYNYQIGGFIGVNEASTISNSYSSCDVSSYSIFGGFIGYNDGIGIINNCYFSGSISPTSGYLIGGFIGYDSGSGSFSHNFWDIEESGTSDGASWQDPDPVDIAGKSTSDMKVSSTFTSAGWTTSNWYFESGSYPRLLWQMPVTSTFTGAGNWSDVGNWSNGLPGSTTDAIIDGTCTVSGTSYADDLTLNSGASLTISSGNTLTAGGNLTLKSDASGTASLINNGTLTVSGTNSAERYMTGSTWHLVSPIAAGGSISTFIQAAGNGIPINGSNYGMMDYNEATNGWKSYFTTATTGDLTAGTGYCIRRSGDGIVTFSGTLTSGNKSVTLVKTGEGWNCVGNPFTSSVKMNTTAHATLNFLTENSSQLDPSYACIYLWDDGSKTYKILGNTSYGERDLGLTVFAPGQAFFVKAISNDASISFKTDIQVHQTGSTFKSTGMSWPGITLTATNEQASSSAIITFDPQMTHGVDPTYDAGILRGSNGLSVYTRLVEDNGVDFAVQCLPGPASGLIVPIGLESNTGGDVTFRFEKTGLEACYLTLEDHQTGIMKSIATPNDTYTFRLEAGQPQYGRFFLRFDLANNIENPDIMPLRAWYSENKIIIEGITEPGARAELYDLQGRQIASALLNNYNPYNPYNNYNNYNNSNSLPLPTYLLPGLYLLRIREGRRQQSMKFTIAN